MTRAYRPWPPQAAPPFYRIEVTADLTVTSAHHNLELSCHGDITLTYSSMSGMANTRVWIKNAGTGTITIAVAGGLDVFVLPDNTATNKTVTSFTLSALGYNSCSIQCNGVDGHVMTISGAIPGLLFVETKTVTAGTSVTFNNLVAGKRYKLVVQLLQN